MNTAPHAEAGRTFLAAVLVWIIAHPFVIVLIAAYELVVAIEALAAPIWSVGGGVRDATAKSAPTQSAHIPPVSLRWSEKDHLARRVREHRQWVQAGIVQRWREAPDYQTAVAPPLFRLLSHVDLELYGPMWDALTDAEPQAAHLLLETVEPLPIPRALTLIGRFIEHWGDRGPALVADELGSVTRATRTVLHLLETRVATTRSPAASHLRVAIRGVAEATPTAFSEAAREHERAVEAVEVVTAGEGAAYQTAAKLLGRE